ncbi:MAG: VanZ family protein [Salibacteraceae bacterium]
MFWKYNYQGIAWALLVLVLCGLPGKNFENSSVTHADAAIHMLMFGVLFFLLAVGFVKQYQYKTLNQKPLLKAFAISVAYGVVTELLQGTVFIDRSIELRDMLFNTAGAVIGIVVFISIYGKKAYL